MRNHVNSPAYAKVQFVLSMTIFGTIGIVVRYIPLPSSVIALARGLIGMLFLLGVALLTKRKVSKVSIRRNIKLLIPSGFFLGMNWVLLFEAYRHTTVATATLCYYLAPMFVILASPFVLKESLSKRKVLCAAIALIGMIFVSGIFKPDGMAGIQLVGVLFGIGAAMLYAGVILLNKKMSDIPSSDMTITQLGIAAVVLLAYTIIGEQMTSTAFTLGTILLLLFVGVLHTGIAYTLYFSSMQRMKAQTIAIFSYIDPAVAILLSVLILSEHMGFADVIGALLILGAAFISEMPARPKASSSI